MTFCELESLNELNHFLDPGKDAVLAFEGVLSEEGFEDGGLFVTT